VEADTTVVRQDTTHEEDNTQIPREAVMRRLGHRAQNYFAVSAEFWECRKHSPEKKRLHFQVPDSLGSAEPLL
jgi:hypothetical protein